MTGLLVGGYLTLVLLSIAATRTAAHNWQRPGREHIARYAAIVAALAVATTAMIGHALFPGNLIVALGPLALSTIYGIDQHLTTRKNPT